MVISLCELEERQSIIIRAERACGGLNKYASGKGHLRRSQRARHSLRLGAWVNTRATYTVFSVWRFFALDFKK